MPSRFDVFSNSYPIISGEYIDVDRRIIRIWNEAITHWCDISFDPGWQGMLQTAKEHPSRFEVCANGAEYARIDGVDPDDPTAGIGQKAKATVIGKLYHKSPTKQAQFNTNLEYTANAKPRESIGYVITNPAPGVESKDYDPTVKNEGRSGIQLTGEAATITDGQGTIISATTTGAHITPKDGVVHLGTENTEHAIATDSINFLQHWLIPLAQSAGLHIMPHVINLPKYIGIGLFVKNIAQSVKFIAKEIRS